MDPVLKVSLSPTSSDDEGPSHGLSAAPNKEDETRHAVDPKKFQTLYSGAFDQVKEERVLDFGVASRDETQEAVERAIAGSDVLYPGEDDTFHTPMSSPRA